MMAAENDVVARVLRRRAEPTQLLQILREAQEELGWISPEAARAIASALDVPVTSVQSVVQFYSFLYDEPCGRYRILFSDNITDRMLGNRGLFEHMLNRLKLKRGEVSADGAVSVNLTSCTGMCDQGPALLVNNRPVTRLTARRVWRRPQAGAAAGGDGRRYRYRNADAASRRRGDAVRSAAGANGVAAPASALRLF